MNILKVIESAEKMVSHNGYVIMDPIYIKPKSETPILNAEGKPTASKENYDKHPYRGLVIASSKFFYNGGLRYESEVKAKEVALFSLSVKPVGEIIIEGIPFAVVRYSDVFMTYEPTPEEIKDMVFEREMTDARKK